MEPPTRVSDLILRPRPLQRFCAFLTARPLLVVPLFLALYGYGTIDRGDFPLLSAAPLKLQEETGRQFLQYSPLTYFLGYPLTTTVGAEWSFAVVMLGGFAFFVAALARLASVRYGPRRNDALLMFFAAPVLIVLTQYLGKSDAYMVAFLLLVVAGGGPATCALCACFVVLSHFEIGLVALGSAVILRIVPARSTIAGGLIGASLVLGYHHYLLPAPPLSRAALGPELMEQAIDALVNTPILHLVLTFGPFWLCVLTARRVEWRWLLVCGATLAIASATLDFTRVFVLLAVPLIVSIIDGVALPSKDGAVMPSRPAWFSVLPLCAFFQAHLLSHTIYDSRIPKLIARLFE